MAAPQIEERRQHTCALLFVYFQSDAGARRLAPPHTQHLPGTPTTHESTTGPPLTVQAGGLVKLVSFVLHVLTGFARVIRARAA
jgi:hypothetical protein